MRSSTTARRGFTLPELLVSLALIIFIMSILAQGFSSATKVVRDTRAAADLAERLAGVMGLMRRDLRAQHLDNPNRRLGDDTWVPNRPSNKGFFRISQYGRPTPLPARVNPAPPPNPPPTWHQVPDSTTLMPDEVTGVPTKASLHFTCRLNGLYPTDYYSATIPTQMKDAAGNIKDAPDQPERTPFLDWMSITEIAEQERRYQRPVNWPSPAPLVNPTPGNPPLVPYLNSPPIPASYAASLPRTAEYRQQWAEVAWWLAPTGEFTTQDLDPNTPAGEAGVQPLYTLRRRQKLLWDDNDPPKRPMTWATNGHADFRDVSLPQFTTFPSSPVPSYYYPNTTTTVTVPALRFGASPAFAQYFNPNVPVQPPAPPPPAPPPPPIPPPQPSYTSDPVWAGLPANTAAPYNQGYTPDDVADIVLADVLSMEVRVLLEEPGNNRKEFVHLSDPSVQAYSMGNPSCNPATVPAGTTPFYLFDTWTNHDGTGMLNYQARDSTVPTDPNYVQRWERPGTTSCVPLYKRKDSLGANTGPVIKIRAIMVVLRLWDVKTGFSRQVTLIQDL